MTDPNNCNKFVSWWDGEYEGCCELPRDHDGPHHDGFSWYDDDGTEVAEPEPKPVCHGVQRMDTLAAAGFPPREVDGCSSPDCPVCQPAAKQD